MIESKDFLKTIVEKRDKMATLTMPTLLVALALI